MSKVKWKINAFGFLAIIGILGYFLDKYGDRILDIIDRMFQVVF